MMSPKEKPFCLDSAESDAAASSVSPMGVPQGVSCCSFLDEHPVAVKSANNANKYTFFMIQGTKLQKYLHIRMKNTNFASFFNEKVEICYE